MEWWLPLIFNADPELQSLVVSWASTVTHNRGFDTFSALQMEGRVPVSLYCCHCSRSVVNFPTILHKLSPLCAWEQHPAREACVPSPGRYSTCRAAALCEERTSHVWASSSFCLPAVTKQDCRSGPRPLSVTQRGADTRSDQQLTQRPAGQKDGDTAATETSLTGHCLVSSNRHYIFNSLHLLSGDLVRLRFVCLMKT